MNGHLIPRTPIAVDFWKVRQCPQARLFFLSHCHADHMEGLSSTWCQPIYCSPVTAEILKHIHGIKETFLRPLCFDQGHIIPMDSKGKETVTVTLVDANHCPGSAMFVFEGYFGTVMYTGDFRFDKNVLEENPVLKKSIDVLYVDNTYCSPKCVFPPRQECEQKIIEIVCDNPDAEIIVAVRNLGKEDLLVKIAQSTGDWIGVSENMYKICTEVLNLPDVFSTDNFETRIRTVPLHKVSAKKFHPWSGEIKPSVVIVPTALYQGCVCRPFGNVKNIHVIPYSDHSSFTELREFVSIVKPKRVIPIVRSDARGPFGSSVRDRADMSVFSDLLDQTPAEFFDIPESVRQYMSSGSLSSPTVPERRVTSSSTMPRKRLVLKPCEMGVIFDDSPEKTPVVEQCSDPSEKTSSYMYSRGKESLGKSPSVNAQAEGESCGIPKQDAAEDFDCQRVSSEEMSKDDSGCSGMESDSSTKSLKNVILSCDINETSENVVATNDGEKCKLEIPASPGIESHLSGYKCDSDSDSDSDSGSVELIRCELILKTDSSRCDSDSSRSTKSSTSLGTQPFQPRNDTSVYEDSDNDGSCGKLFCEQKQNLHELPCTQPFYPGTGSFQSSDMFGESTAVIGQFTTIRSGGDQSDDTYLQQAGNHELYSDKTKNVSSSDSDHSNPSIRDRISKNEKTVSNYYFDNQQPECVEKNSEAKPKKKSSRKRLYQSSSDDSEEFVQSQDFGSMKSVNSAKYCVNDKEAKLPKIGCVQKKQKIEIYWPFFKEVPVSRRVSELELRRSLRKAFREVLD